MFPIFYILVLGCFSYSCVIVIWNYVYRTFLFSFNLDFWKHTNSYATAMIIIESCDLIDVFPLFISSAHASSFAVLLSWFQTLVLLVLLFSYENRSLSWWYSFDQFNVLWSLGLCYVDVFPVFAWSISLLLLSCYCVVLNLNLYSLLLTRVNPFCLQSDPNYLRSFMF